MHKLFGEAVMQEIANKLSYDKSLCVCVCRSDAGSNRFEAPQCHGQLDPKDNQDCEDPTEYCYGTVHQTVNTSAFTAATL